jgi:hypothetical protein
VRGAGAERRGFYVKKCATCEPISSRHAPAKIDICVDTRLLAGVAPASTNAF